MTAISQNLGPLQRQQSALHPFVENRKEAVDPLLCVRDLNDHGGVLRDREEAFLMQCGRLSESERAAQHRRRGHMLPASAFQDRQLERLKPAAVAGAGKYPQQHGLVREFHDGVPDERRRAKTPCLRNAFRVAWSLACSHSSVVNGRAGGAGRPTVAATVEPRLHRLHRN